MAFHDPCPRHPSKRKFRTEAAAEKRLAEIIANPQTERIPSFTYECPFDKEEPHWHLGSTTQVERVQKYNAIRGNE